MEKTNEKQPENNLKKNTVYILSLILCGVFLSHIYFDFIHKTDLKDFLELDVNSINKIEIHAYVKRKNLDIKDIYDKEKISAIIDHLSTYKLKRQIYKELGYKYFDKLSYSCSGTDQDLVTAKIDMHIIGKDIDYYININYSYIIIEEHILDSKGNTKFKYNIFKTVKSGVDYRGILELCQ